MNKLIATLLVVASALVSTGAHAGNVTFSDPKGDDNGPGTYTYPTDAVYTKGSFDLTEVVIADKGDTLEINLTVNAPLADPWGSEKRGGANFSVQMFEIYVDTGAGGQAKALPGMNATFAEDSKWEKVIMVSPQPLKDITTRLDTKAKDMKTSVVIPTKVSAKGKKVTAIVKKADLGITDPAKAGWQVLVASNEGYDNDPNNGVLARIVNEFEGPHRFGGGDDGNADPNFVDCLAGKGKGGDDEKAAQAAMLKFDAKAKKQPVLSMIRP